MVLNPSWSPASSVLESASPFSRDTDNPLPDVLSIYEAVMCCVSADLCWQAAMEIICGAVRELLQKYGKEKMELNFGHAQLYPSQLCQGRRCDLGDASRENGTCVLAQRSCRILFECESMTPVFVHL
jgi:hypothetical protein